MRVAFITAGFPNGTVLLFDPARIPGFGPLVLAWSQQHSALAESILIVLILALCLLPFFILRLLGASFRELASRCISDEIHREAL